MRIVTATSTTKGGTRHLKGLAVGFLLGDRRTIRLVSIEAQSGGAR